MENLRFYLERWYLVPQAIFRLCLILINNVYCIPTYVVWMLLLSPLKKLHPDSYWKIEGYFFHWLLAIVSMWSWSAGYDIVELGDDVTPCIGEKTLVIANHQSTADVPLLMACFNPKEKVLNGVMWIMDKLFKYTNFGVVSTLHDDFFILAGRDKRQATLEDLAKHLMESYIPEKREWIVLFPEGGFLRNRKATSQKFAEKNNLPVLHNVTVPRVGALQVIMSTIGPHSLINNNTTNHLDGIKSNSLKWILDITIAYPLGIPLDLKTIVFGHRPPCQTIFFYRLYKSTEIPQDTEAMTQWLYKRFEEKEVILETFYRTRKIPVEDYCLNPIPPRLVSQDLLRFLILHMFFITSTYVHYHMFSAIYSCYTSFMY